MLDLTTVKLGKKAAKYDYRTIQLKSILRALPVMPDVFDVDSQYYQILKDNNMYGNDQWGDCVIAGRGHMTLRFECFEQKACIKISDTEILNEYWKEGRKTLCNKKPDNGLVMLTSLNAWRKGWKAAGKKYDVYAYAQIHPAEDLQEMQAAMYLLNGMYVGVALPISAQTQTIWDVDNSPNGKPGSWGGHCIYIKAYDLKNKEYTCVTWGYEQVMTKAFLDKYCDEAYAIVDDKDKFLANSPVDIVALEKILKQIG